MADSSFTKRLATAALLFALIAGFYWKLTLTTQYEWMRGPDLAEQVLPWFEVQAAEWHVGRAPLWDPYVWMGQPILGQAQPGAAYPLNWILFALPLRNGHIAPNALAWYFVVIHFMAAAFCYLLCRDLGRSRVASIAGGLIFALSGFLGNTAWPQMMNGAVWAPLVFLFQLRVRRDGREAANAALSGMFLGIAFLSGHHQVPIFLAIAWAGVWIWLAVKDRGLIPVAALALMIAGLTGALQTLPAYEYGHLARRWVGTPQPLEWNQAVPYTVHAHYDLKPSSLFAVVFPDVQSHFDPFVGIVALALALLGIACAWRDARVRVLSAIGAGALLYALGQNSIFQGLLYALVPTLDKARTPSAAMVLFQFAAAALGACGVDHLAGGWTRRAQWSLTLFGGITVAASLWVMVTHKLTFPGDDRVILTGIVALLLAGLLYAHRRQALSAAATDVLLVMLLLFELGAFAQRSLFARDDSGQMTWLNSLRSNSDIAEFLRKQKGFFRTEVEHEDFAPNWGAWHGVEMFAGLGASVPFNVLDSELFSNAGHRLWGVAYSIARAPKPGAGKEVFTGSSGMKVYRRDPFPRAWAVHELVRGSNRSEASLQAFDDPETFHYKAYLREPPRVEACTVPAHVELIEHAPAHLAITAELFCDGMVILSDPFFPGWQARVDGRPATIYEVNGAMRGVLVPHGSHTITMRYRPMSVYLGAGLTLAGVLGALVIAAATSRRTAAKTPCPQSPTE